MFEREDLDPVGIAIDDQHIYVIEDNPEHAYIFTKDGVFVSMFGGPGVEPGQFDHPVGIAVDNQWIYVSDVPNADAEPPAIPLNRVQKFTKAGVFVSQFTSVISTSPYRAGWDIAVDK